VYKSTILQYAIQFKWETSVLGMQKKMMMTNFLSVMLATFTMLVLTHDVPWERDWMAKSLIVLTWARPFPTTARPPAITSGLLGVPG
jgi:hypothetical protein